MGACLQAPLACYISPFLKRSLKKKTWGLEPMVYKEGERGFILPKGVRFDQAASVQDGRDIVLIRLNDPEYRAEVEKRLF